MERPVCRAHIIQKKAKGGSEKIRQQKGGKKKYSTAFLTTFFLNTNPTQDSREKITSKKTVKKNHVISKSAS